MTSKQKLSPAEIGVLVAAKNVVQSLEVVRDAMVTEIEQEVEIVCSIELLEGAITDWRDWGPAGSNKGVFE